MIFDGVNHRKTGRLLVATLALPWPWWENSDFSVRGGDGGKVPPNICRLRNAEKLRLRPGFLYDIGRIPFFSGVGG